jgi:hypothetical protein
MPFWMFQYRTLRVFLACGFPIGVAWEGIRTADTATEAARTRTKAKAFKVLLTARITFVKNQTSIQTKIRIIIRNSGVSYKKGNANAFGEKFYYCVSTN